MQPNAVPFTLAWRFWVVVLLVGVGAGLAGGLLTLLLHLVQDLAFGYHDTSFQAGVDAAPWWRRLLVPTLAGLVAGLGWWWLRGPVSRRLGPMRGVSGAVWTPDARMGLRRTVLDGLLQIVVVAMGASLGREGAPREIAAALGSRLGELTGLTDDQRRLLVACGAGAGLAAVYDVPFGGALFTLEVLLGSLALPVAIPAAVTATLGAVVAWSIVGDAAVYAVPPFPTTGAAVVFAVLAAPVCGLAAVGFVRLVTWSRGPRPTGWRLPVATTVVFAAIGALATGLPELLGNGKGPTQIVLDGDGPVLVLAALVLLKPLATVASLRAGASGGLFTPTLATGALLGALLGHGWVLLWPGSPVGAFALIGAAAFVAAALQAPLAAVVLVLELTRVGTGLLVPVTLAAVLGVLVARLVEPRSTTTAGLLEPPTPPSGRKPSLE
ncbi:chloride channel protein [Actinomycetospora corticicola]